MRSLNSRADRRWPDFHSPNAGRACRGWPVDVREPARSRVTRRSGVQQPPVVSGCSPAALLRRVRVDLIGRPGADAPERGLAPAASGGGGVAVARDGGRKIRWPRIGEIVQQWAAGGGLRLVIQVLPLARFVEVVLESLAERADQRQVVPVALHQQHRVVLATCARSRISRCKCGRP